MRKHTLFKRLISTAILASAVVSSTALAGYAGLVFTPASANFGTLPVGTTSATQLFTASIENSGKAATPAGYDTINSITLPTGYELNGGTCPASGPTVFPCTIGIRFRPTAVGVQAGNVVVNATVLGFTQNNNLPVTGAGGSVTQLPANNGYALAALLGSLVLVGGYFARRR